MEVSRERSGNMLLVTLATGKIIKRTASVFTSIRTETSMRVSGKEINATDKVHTGGMKLENCVVNTPVIGSKTKSMAEVHSSIKTVIVMMATGLLVCLKVKEE